MLRMLLGGVLVLLLGVGLVLADEAKGKFKEIKKGLIVLKVDGKDKEFKMGKETKVLKGTEELKGKEKGKALKELKEDEEITIIYEKDGEKIIVKEVKLK